MNWRQKYNFGTDRKVGDFYYRYQNDFEIRRSAVGFFNFGPWKEFDNPGDCRREWRRLCEQAEPAPQKERTERT